ncbi:MAG: transcription termination factor NusA, partial [Candidatus Omnitrophota bacterium]
MNEELLSALDRIEREKGISKEVLFQAIESALVSAARKVIEDKTLEKEDITVKMNKETGEIKVYRKDVEVKSERFGRIAAQTAKQVIIQRIREAERDVVHDKYLQKVGTIISGSVHRFEKGNVIVELDDAEAVLPRSEQLPREKFRQGEAIRAYLLDIKRESGAPEIILSRSDIGFVKKLFELEVPEISQGIIEIKAVAREAGERTKVAVYSKDEKVDAVGACVGMRGARVKDIVSELHGERIDIVRWNDDIREYLKNAVSPAEITKLAIDREKKEMVLYVTQDQLSLVIGKKGRNIRLASKLLGWDLNVESLGERKISVAELEGISEKVRQALESAGYVSADELKKAGAEQLAKLEGIDEETAESILSVCDKVLAEAAARRKEEEQVKAEAEKKGTEEESEAEEKVEVEVEEKKEAKEEVEEKEEVKEEE